ncbi:MAG: HAD-IA family hydrolase [Bradymonadales bacterium]
MKKPIKCIIFDLDGTLLNTLNALATACNLALSDFALKPRELDEYRHLVGNGARRLCEQASGLGGERLEEFMQNYFMHYERILCDDSGPYDGVVQCLDELKQRNIRSAVYTNKPQAWSDRLLAHYLPGRFELIVGAQKDLPVKPHPWGVEQIQKHLAVERKSICLIGDSDVDIMTAKAAQIMSIGAAWGFRGRQELQAAGADYIIDDATQLLALMDSLP